MSEIQDAKRAKFEVDASVRSLVKTKPSMFSGGSFPSSCHLQSCRVAARQAEDGSATIYFTSERSIYSIHHKSEPGMKSVRGKEGMLLPTRSPENPEAQTFFSGKTGFELQSLCLSSDLILGAIDSRGVIHCISLASSDPGGPIIHLEPPRSLSSREEGWTTIAFSSDPQGLASASHKGKCLTTYDMASGGQGGTYHTVGHPSALCWGGEAAGLIAVAEEGRGISLWDPRQDKPVQTVIQPHNSSSCETVHSLSWVPPILGGFGAQGGGMGGGGINPSSSSMGLLASAGTDRQVTFYEPQKWQTVGRWGGTAKYAITGALFSINNPRYCYVSSLDYEVTCGRWEPYAYSASGSISSGNSNSLTGGHGRAIGPSLKVHPAVAAAQRNDSSLSFRGDSRWLGMAHMKGPEGNQLQAGENIVAFSQSGSIYVLKSS